VSVSFFPSGQGGKAALTRVVRAGSWPQLLPRLRGLAQVAAGSLARQPAVAVKPAGTKAPSVDRPSAANAMAPTGKLPVPRLPPAAQRPAAAPPTTRASASTESGEPSPAVYSPGLEDQPSPKTEQARVETVKRGAMRDEPLLRVGVGAGIGSRQLVIELQKASLRSDTGAYSQVTAELELYPLLGNTATRSGLLPVASARRTSALPHKPGAAIVLPQSLPWISSCR